MAFPVGGVPRSLPIACGGRSCLLLVVVVPFHLVVALPFGGGPLSLPIACGGGSVPVGGGPLSRC